MREMMQCFVESMEKKVMLLRGEEGSAWEVSMDGGIGNTFSEFK